MTCGIYKITNKINGKIYIGLSKNIEKRWDDHLKKMTSTREYNKSLYKSFRKYGVENFSFEILEECLTQELPEKESYWIRKSKSTYLNMGYNRSYGGESGTFQKIDSQKLEEIYNLLLNSKITNKEIGYIYGLTDQMVSDINCGRSWFNTKHSYPLREQRVPNNYCLDCGAIITKDKKTKRCTNCYILKTRKTERPKKEDLIKEIKKSNIFQIGEKYGVSDNAIRKWLKYYGLPTSTKDIKLL